MEEKKAGIEENLRELSEIIERMEKGDLTLSESLQEFEKGVSVVRQASSLLDEAEARLKVLSENGEQYDL